MRLHPAGLAFASALAFAVIWTLCTALVVALPGAADIAFRGMMHASTEMPRMQVSVFGFVVGLLGWALSAAITGGALALFYNAISGGKSAS